jgi:hypothetical protein
MTLGNMRELGVKRLVASCLSDACRHTALINVSKYAAEVEVPRFCLRVKCGECGSRNIDVRPKTNLAPRNKARIHATDRNWRDVTVVFAR